MVHSQTLLLSKQVKYISAISFQLLLLATSFKIVQVNSSGFEKKKII